MSGIRQWSRPELQRISVDGLSVAVETVRNGSPARHKVAWLHGLGGASTLTFAQVARDPALMGTTSLLIDLPGHGLSDRPADWSYTIEGMAEIVIEVLARLKTGPVVLFGHSLGGSIAIEVATRAQEALTALIVAEPNLDPGVGQTSAHIAAQGESEFVERGHRVLQRAVRLSRSTGSASSTWPETLRIASPVGLHRSSVSLLAARTPTFRHQLEALSLPAHLIAGDQDDPVAAPLANPAVRIHRIAGAGHEMWVDQPAAFTATLCGILDAPRTGTHVSRSSPA